VHSGLQETSRDRVSDVAVFFIIRVEMLLTVIRTVAVLIFTYFVFKKLFS